MSAGGMHKMAAAAKMAAGVNLRRPPPPPPPMWRETIYFIAAPEIKTNYNRNRITRWQLLQSLFSIN